MLLMTKNGFSPSNSTPFPPSQPPEFYDAPPYLLFNFCFLIMDSNFVYNYLSITLNKAMEAVLNRGLNFSNTPKKYNLQKFR